MFDYSIGEVESLVLKAFRGAGFSWGLAQEAGNAAGWMAMHGLPAIDQFDALLASTDRQSIDQLTPLIDGGSAWFNAGGLLLCPVVSGVAFAECDLQNLDLHTGLVLHNVLQPLIALPFIAHGAKLLQSDLQMQSGDYKIVCSKQGQGINIITAPNDPDTVSTVHSNLEIKVAGYSEALCAQFKQRANVTSSSVASLSKLAHRTYVQATEESRKGAGAGFLDND